jgi:thermostable 8-oxoguanine DNA glycosylase
MTTLTINDAFNGASELLTGENVPSLKLALFAAAMSPLQALHKNGLQTRILANYVASPLPTQDDLFEELKAARGNINRTHMMALYSVEDIANRGILDQFVTMGKTYEDQTEWREGLLTHLKGRGMARKTISFAGLIYNPLECDLVPVDRHVMKRLGYKTDNSPASKKKYFEVETRIIEERKQAGYESVPLGIWHWYKWEEWRQINGDSLNKSGVESHKLLSCRIY